MNITGTTKNREKILMVFLPFWTPYIPPQGMTLLKSYLGKHGYEVKTVDVNMEAEFRLLYAGYFDTLREWVPENRRGNFYNVGHDVLFNHMMMHLNCKNEKMYVDLSRIIIYKTFYTELEKEQLLRLKKILDEVYAQLKVRISQLVAAEKPAVFGSTLYYGTLPASMYAYQVVKAIDPKIKTLAGGGSFSDHLMEDSVNYKRFLEKTESYLDNIFIGQGQILFLQWLQGKLPKNQRIYSLRDIGNRTVDISTDVDMPDLSDLNVQEYPYMAATGSRSCPFSCSFCNVKNFWGEHKVKNVKQTLDEMIQLHRKYGNQLFFMYDALLNSFITEISTEMIESDFSLYYVGYLKACEEACDPKNTIHWRRGGFYRARLGLESGSQKVLDIIEKGITPDMIRKSVKNLAYAGIKTTTYWIVGHPGETEADFQQTLDLIEELKNDIWESECNPFNYFYSGQQHGDQWAHRRLFLYPEEAWDTLVTQTWTLDIDPVREEVYDRMNRFVQHCKKLGIPNPYTVHEIYQADERWKRLQKNAVPSLIDLRDRNNYIQESKQIKEFIVAQKATEDDGDFAF